MTAFAPTLRCSCQAAHLAPAFRYEAPPAAETRFDLKGAAYRRGYDACGLCGHWFGHHDLDLSDLYAMDYVDASYGGPEGMAAKLQAILSLPPERSDNAGRVARIAAAVGDRPGRRLLDVGAGLGVFPSAMKEAGWQVTALEPDPRTVAHLRQHVGCEALDCDLAAVDPAAHGPFDLITFNKVLEHVEDPVGLLAQAAPLLARDGFCYVEVPDVAAAVDGPDREEFFIEHHHVFSPASLVNLVERALFSLTSISRLREPSGKYTLVAVMRKSLCAEKMRRR